MIETKMREIVDKSGMTKTKSAELLGISQPRFAQWLSGKNHPSEENIQKFCSVFNTTPNFLFGFDCETYTKSDDIVKIDVLDVSACCGTGITNITENVIGHQFVSRSLLKEYTFSAPENIKIIRAVGDSMIPTINPSDMLWVDISVKEPSSDGLYLLCVGQDLMIKRIQINPFNNQVQVKSDNPAYAPIVMDNYHEISCLGKVVYHMKRVG